MKAVIEELESLSPRSSLSREQVLSKRTRPKVVGVLAAILACVAILALLYLRPWAVHDNGLSSIAVLAFEDMSPDKDQEYFCDGMAEELINALSQIEDLRVIARTSAFSFKGKNVPIPDIGSQLNVTTILEGSVRKAGNRLRITAQLVDTTGGHHLWSERYERDMGDVFAIQDEITSAIVDKLMPTLLGKQEVRLTNRQPVDLEVYDLYLKGLFFWNRRGETNLKKAIEHFELAITKDPNYAPAYAGLARSYGNLPIYGSLPPKEVVLKAREMALEALKIDETLAEAYASLGFIKTWYDWDWEGAEQECRQAIDLNPGYALAHMSYAFNLLFRAQFDRALKEMEQALELDPLSVTINHGLGMVCINVGQLDRAVNVLKRTLEMDPSGVYAHHHLGEVYFGKSMYEEALEEFKKEREISKGASIWTELYIGGTYVEMSKPDEAQKVLNDLLERSKTEYISPLVLAGFHFVLGKKEEGFTLLDKAYKEKDTWMCWLKIERLFDSIRSDPRYIELLKKMNLDH